MSEKKVLTDEELCEWLGMEMPTVRKHLRDGPPVKRNPDTKDIRKIAKFNVGGERRWVASSVQDFIDGKL